MLFATFTIRKKHLREHVEGFYTAEIDGKGTVSVQPDGSIEFRPAGTVGAWEKFVLREGRCVFFEVDGLDFSVPYEE